MYEQHEYPRGIFHTSALTNVAQGVGVSGREQKISHFVISGGAAAEIVIFRRSGAGAEHFRVPVGIGGTVVVDKGFEAPDGLEVLTDSVAGDVAITIFYFLP